VEVEYVSEKPDFGDANGFMDPLMEDFQRIFDKFILPEAMSLELTKVPILSLEIFEHPSLLMTSQCFDLVKSRDVLSIEDFT